jgi:hypothetical protein
MATPSKRQQHSNGGRSDAPVSLVRATLVTLIIAAALSACANVEIGPVDHSCHGNPQRGRLESGCGGGGH